MSRSSCKQTPASWTLRVSRARSVGEFVPTLMRPAFEKYGFPAAAILTDWAAIAGLEMAAYTAPERLKWPRKAPGDNDEQRGATLILRVAGARALEVEHMRGPLIERINACFGYRAVAEIRVIQAPVGSSKPAARRNLPAPSQYSDALGTITDARLKTAFARMASGIAGAIARDAKK